MRRTICRPLVMAETRTHLIIPLVVAIASSACAGGPQPPTLPPANKMIELVKLNAPTLVSEPSVVSATSATVYSRIARGTRECWFGPGGRLNKSHIFFAAANSSVDGGAVEITVHERAINQPKPWGYKAYRIKLKEAPGLDGSTSGGNTSIEVENVRMTDQQARWMRQEIFRWANGKTGCNPEAVTAFRATQPAAAVSEADKAPRSKKKRKKKRQAN